MSKYCQYCGKEIDDDSSFCPYCSKNLVSNQLETGNAVVTNNYFNNQTSNLNLKVMNASRVFLYYMVTLGIYQIYWFYKNNKVLRDGFNKDVSPILRTIGLFIPIINWVVYYLTLRDFRDLLEERNLKSFSLGFNLIFIILFGMFGLNIFATLNVQEYINDLCMYEDPSITINREYETWEKVLILAIPVIIILIVFFIMLLSLSVMVHPYPYPYHYY
ncbi:MAG: zinc ribbon domain-containing protein [archaeon]|nr:zinc ribbon domain-containing protein [archaeon]